MGYTTEFKGQFRCYRAESTEVGHLPKAVYQGDRAAIAVFADWLSDRGDPRGERIAQALSRPSPAMALLWRLFGLKPEHAEYLKRFNETRRMRRDPAKARLLPDPVREAV